MNDERAHYWVRRGLYDCQHRYVGRVRDAGAPENADAPPAAHAALLPVDVEMVGVVGPDFRSDRRRERFLAVYGPLLVLAWLTFWASALVLAFALLQWSQRELLLNLDGTPHFSDGLYMSATTLFALGLGDIAPKGRGGRLLVVAETGSSSCCSGCSSHTFQSCISRSRSERFA